MNRNMRSKINEALGVPENIFKTAVQVYKNLVNVLRSKSINDFKEEDNKPIILRGNFRISDYRFNEIKFTINVKKLMFVEEPTIFSMMISSKVELGKNLKLNIKSTDSLTLSMLIGVPEDFDTKNIIGFIINRRTEIINTLSHELKHGYDRFKKPSEDVTKRAEYNAVSGKRFGIMPIDQFLHDIYYTTISESLVRPSEIETAIKNNRISQKDFLNFLQKNDTYINLKRISNFSTTKMKSELKKDIPRIEKLLTKVGIDISDLSDDEKIDEVLRLVWVNVTNWNIESIREVLTENFLERVIGFQGEKERIFKRFVNRNHRFNNYQEFFNFYEKYLHDIANKMIRKVSKLYALTN